jgi:hypothetical protein
MKFDFSYIKYRKLPPPTPMNMRFYVRYETMVHALMFFLNQFVFFRYGIVFLKGFTVVFLQKNLFSFFLISFFFS